MQRCPTCNSFFDDSVATCPYDGAQLVPVAIGGAKKEVDLVGNLFADRFQVIRVIGEGGMGKVYEGVDQTTQQSVAIKVLHRDISTDERSVKRFMSEARLLQSLSHPNIIQLYAFGKSHDGLLYIAMEMLSGRPADQLIKSGDITRIEAIQILDQVANALGEAHLQGIIHRDLKPANIFVSPGAGMPHVTVLDFGIAKVAGGQSLTVTGKVMGTPSYMAPEQIAGKQPNPRVDIYALGILAYELLVGRPPFVADMPIELLYLHLHEPAPPITTLVPPSAPISNQLSDILLTFLAKDPDERPRNTVEVRKLFEPFLVNPETVNGAAGGSPMSNAATMSFSGEDVESLANTPLHTPVVTPAPPVATQRVAAGAPAAPKKNLTPWIILLVVALLVAIGLALAVVWAVQNAKGQKKSHLDRPAVERTIHS